MESIGSEIFNGVKSKTLNCFTAIKSCDGGFNFFLDLENGLCSLWNDTLLNVLREIEDIDMMRKVLIVSRGIYRVIKHDEFHWSVSGALTGFGKYRFSDLLYDMEEVMSFLVMNQKKIIWKEIGASTALLLPIVATSKHLSRLRSTHAPNTSTEEIRGINMGIDMQQNFRTTGKDHQISQDRKQQNHITFHENVLSRKKKKKLECDMRGFRSLRIDITQRGDFVSGGVWRMDIRVSCGFSFIAGICRAPWAKALERLRKKEQKNWRHSVLAFGDINDPNSGGYSSYTERLEMNGAGLGGLRGKESDFRPFADCAHVVGMEIDMRCKKKIKTAYGLNIQPSSPAISHQEVTLGQFSKSTSHSYERGGSDSRTLFFFVDGVRCCPFFKNIPSCVQFGVMCVGTGSMAEVLSLRRVREGDCAAVQGAMGSIAVDWKRRKEVKGGT